MKVVQEDYTKLVLPEGNQQIFLISSAGGGKTVAAESILEEYHEKKYLVISVTDPKNEIELAYAQFLPEERYHLRELRMIGKQPSVKKVKVYHPFTFNIPKYKEIPPFNFFTFPLKDIGREELSFITETPMDMEIARSVKIGLDDLGRDESIYDLMLNLQESIRPKKKRIGGKEIAVPDPDNFNLKTGGTGTSKTISDISSYFKPFLWDYFLAPQNSKMNLDVREIFNDQESYHVLSYKFIKDEKMRDFISMRWFNTILENRDLCKHPIVFYIPEVKILTPFKPKGSKEFLAASLKKKLAGIRSIGKGGNSSVMESQTHSGVDKEVRDSATTTLIGKIGGISDIDAISKALKWTKEVTDMLSTMQTGNFLLKGMERYLQSFKIFVPSHMHKEEKYTYFDTYRQHFPEKMVKYADLVNQIAELRRAHFEKAKDRAKKDYLEEKKVIEEKVEAVKEKEGIKEKLEKAKVEISSTKEKEKEHLKRECLRLYAESRLPDGKKATYRSIAKHLAISDKTVKGYITEQQHKSSEPHEDSPPDENTDGSE